MTTEAQEGKKPKLKTERQVMAWRKRVINKRTPVAPYRCVGGPFNGATIILTKDFIGDSSPADTAIFKVGHYYGRYVTTNAVQSGCVQWQPCSHWTPRA